MKSLQQYPHNIRRRGASESSLPFILAKEEMLDLCLSYNSYGEPDILHQACHLIVRILLPLLTTTEIVTDKRTNMGLEYPAYTLRLFRDVLCTFLLWPL